MGNEEMRQRLADLLGLTPTNPWLWELEDAELRHFYQLAHAGLFEDIPLPIATAPNGLQVLGDPGWHEVHSGVRL